MTTVMLVDDDKSIRKFLSRFLKNHGFDTIDASDGDEAIKTYLKEKPDIVILDIVMPNKEGIETIADLKKINPGVNVIAVSGGGRTSPELYLAMAKKMGAVAAFQKPLDREELLAKVNEISANL